MTTKVIELSGALTRDNNALASREEREVEGRSVAAVAILLDGAHARLAAASVFGPADGPRATASATDDGSAVLVRFREPVADVDGYRVFITVEGGPIIEQDRLFFAEGEEDGIRGELELLSEWNKNEQRRKRTAPTGFENEYEFFINFHAALMPAVFSGKPNPTPAEKRQFAIMRQAFGVLWPELRLRLDARVMSHLGPPRPDLLEFPDGLVSELTVVARKMRSLFDAAGLKGYSDRAIAMERFAAGHLRVSNEPASYHLNAEPNSAAFLMFAEFALVAHEKLDGNHQTKGYWLDMARICALSESLYLRAYPHTASPHPRFEERSKEDFDKTASQAIDWSDVAKWRATFQNEPRDDVADRHCVNCISTFSIVD